MAWIRFCPGQTISTPSARAPQEAISKQLLIRTHVLFKIEGVANCFIAGYAVPDTDLLELARVVNDRDLAERLEGAYGRGVRVFGLQIAEREHVLWALDEPPTKALAELRSLLLAEHIGRVRDGLV